MPSQIFKNYIPNDILFELLNEIAVKCNNCLVINNISFKKGLFSDSISKFIETCKPYYHLSKRKYLDKKLTYNSFITIIRQICNNNKITYTSQIKYNKSSYEIVYYIYT